MLGAVLATLLFAIPSDAVNLQIVHWNDVHARNTPASEGSQQLCLNDTCTDPECYGGHARIATVCREAKAANPNTLCIDAGDEFLGTSWDLVFNGTQNIEVLPMVPTDVMTIGNHEFDYGVGVLANFIDEVSPSFPVIGACNMDLSGEPSLSNIQRWAVIDLPDIKVALLGYIAPDTAALSSTGAVTFSDPVESMQACLADFTASPDSEGVGAIGFVSHTGLPADRAVATAIGEQVNFIISAHTHTPMFPELIGDCLDQADNGTCLVQDTSEVPYLTVENGVPICQQYYASKYAGVVTLDIEAGELQEVVAADSVPLGRYYVGEEERSVAEYQPVVDALTPLFEQVKAFANSVVGALPEALSAARPDIRIKEMPLGNIICDAILDALFATGYTEEPDAPLVCLQNGGGIRADLPAGDVTFGDVSSVLPFGNTITVLDVTGATLLEALENGYSDLYDLEGPAGKFAQLGGNLSVVIDTAQPPGSRIVEAYVGCEPVTADATYRLATNNFLADGGDEYTALEGANVALIFGPALNDALAQWLTAKTEAGGGTVDPAELAIDGRIFDINPDKPAEADVGVDALCGDVADGGDSGGSGGDDLPPLPSPVPPPAPSPDGPGQGAGQGKGKVGGQGRGKGKAKGQGKGKLNKNKKPNGHGHAKKHVHHKEHEH